MNLSPLIPLHACPADTPADDKPSIILDGGPRSAELGSDEAFILSFYSAAVVSRLSFTEMRWVEHDCTVIQICTH